MYAAVTLESAALSVEVVSERASHVVWCTVPLFSVGMMAAVAGG